MGTDKPKFTVIVDSKTLDRIEEYRYIYKLRSKSAAAAELIIKGLDSIKKEEDTNNEL